MNTRELIKAIARKHGLDLSQASMALMVDSFDGKHGQIFLVPNYNERQHLVKLAAKVADNKVIKLTIYYDSQWKTTKAVNDETGLEIDDLDRVETQLGELITRYYLVSTSVTVVQSEAES
jgi:hypothetical protein